MKIKNLCNMKLLFVMMAWLLNWHNMTVGMHFKKDPELNKILEGLNEEEAENLRIAFRNSRTSVYCDKYPVHSAIMRGCLEDVQVIINFAEDASIIDQEDDEGKTPLYVAAFYKNEQAIKLLLEKGAQPDRVLQHSESGFLKKNSHKKINDLLSNRKHADTSKASSGSDLSIINASAEPSSSNILPADSKTKKRSISRTKINKQTMSEILKKINNNGDDGIYIFTGLITKLINQNDYKGLSTLFKSKFYKEQSVFVEDCLKDENILFHAINCAPIGDYRIVHLIISQINIADVSYYGIDAYHMAARLKKDDKLAAIIETYWPNRSLVNKSKMYNCDRVLAFNKPYDAEKVNKMLTQNRLRKKLRGLIAKTCAIGIAAVGLLCYQFLKNDQIYVTPKLK